MFNVIAAPSGAEQRIPEILGLVESKMPHLGYDVNFVFHEESWGGSTTTAADSETIHVNGWHTFRSPVQDVAEAIAHEMGHQFDGHYLIQYDRWRIWEWFDKDAITGWELNSGRMVPYGRTYSWASHGDVFTPPWNYRIGEAFASQYVKTFWPDAAPPFPTKCKPSRKTARLIGKLIKSRLP